MWLESARRARETVLARSVAPLCTPKWLQGDVSPKQGEVVAGDNGLASKAHVAQPSAGQCLSVGGRSPRKN